jgi:hypothetical protein
VFAIKAFKKLFAEEDFNLEKFGLTQDVFDALPNDQRQMIIDRWGDRLDAKARYENNPICRKLAELSKIGNKLKMSGTYESLVNDVAFPASRSSWVIHSTEFRDIEAKTLIPKFYTPYFDDMLLVQDISRLIALDKLIRLTEN